jgi:hypothetical protein
MPRELGKLTTGSKIACAGTAGGLAGLLGNLVRYFSPERIG